MEKAKELKKNDIRKSLQIREKNRPLTYLFKNKTGERELEDYPQERVRQDKQPEQRAETHPAQPYIRSSPLEQS